MNPEEMVALWPQSLNLYPSTYAVTQPRRGRDGCCFETRTVQMLMRLLLSRRIDFKDDAQ